MLHRRRLRALQAPSTGLALAFLALLSVLLLPGPASGAPDEAARDDAVHDDLDDTRDRMEEVAAELELLRQSDLELEARLVDLDARIAAQEQAVADRRAAVDAASARVAELDTAVTAAEARVAEHQDAFDERVVSAYVRAGSSEMEALLAADDYNQLHERAVLMRQVAGHDRQVLADLLAARSALAEEQAAAAAARAEADRLAAEADQALADLEASRAEQEAVRWALDARIAGFQAEADALAADEAELIAVIQARAAAATTTTTAPPTTAPPTTTPGTSTPPSPPSSTPGQVSTTTTTTAAPTTTVVTTPPTTRPGPGFRWPVGGVVTSPFGPRWGRMHQGIDIAATTGTPIVAASGGTVILADWFGGYGNAVLVDHGGGFVTLYAHQSSISVTEGQTVSAGQTVGLVGSTGHSTGPHLHFEVRVDSVPQDPLLYLP